MTRPLVVLDAADVAGVGRALRAALTADGPAILPRAGVSTGSTTVVSTGSTTEGSTVSTVSTVSTTAGGVLPATVAQRTALVIETSGSTGRPKRVELSADALLASAAASEAALGGAGEWLLALPLNYIAGVAVLVRSIVAGTEARVLSTLGAHFDPADFVAVARSMQHPRRFTSLVPAQLARLVDDPASVEVLRGFERILVGGQAMPDGLAERTSQLGLRVTRTYGSSETSGGCVYDGLPIGAAHVRVVDGRIRIAGPMLAEGYLGEPERTATAFVTDEGERWYLTDDAGVIEHGLLRVTGRLDDVIVSGGLKVSLAEVEAEVRAISGLAEAVVVRAPDVRWGEVPVVFAVASAVPAPDLARVRAAVARRLGKAAAPARIVVLDELPLLASGKPDRVALVRLARE